MKSIGIYYRVSTDKQELVSQKHAVEQWLAELPEDARPKKVQIFSDEGKSGSDGSRKGYRALLDAAYARKIDTIVVYRLDRFSRDASEAIKILLSLDQAGVTFISITQPVLNLGRDNPFRRTMLAVFSEIAEIEREAIVVRVKAGLKAAAARGVKLGKPTKITPELAEQVRQRREAGMTLMEVSRDLELSYGLIQKVDKQKILERGVK